jgi:transposase
MTTATQTDFTRSAGVLYLAFELGANTWKLAFTVGLGQKPRLKTVTAGALGLVKLEIARAKQRFGLSAEAAVKSCYEAGRDGFWLHRWLLSQAIDNQVVDSSSIEVNRRQRRAKSDGLDATKLAEMLVRYALGETRVWRVAQPPTPEQEDARHLHREIETMQHERRQLANRISGLLVSLGVRVTVNHRFAQRLPHLRQYDGTPLPAGLMARLEREFERWQLVHRQLLTAERELKQRAQQEAATSPQLQGLLSLRGVGAKGAWLLLREGLTWRKFRNRREVASMAGLVPTPYGSGTMAREQGISKAGNARVRTLLVELAWGWLGYQPQSELTQWYYRRFAAGNGRSRKVGIVALARKLLVALWRCAVHGEVPAGAHTVDWESKFRRSKASPAAA